MSSDRVRIGIVGSRFEADIHAASVAMGCHGEVVAVASPTPGDARALADRYGVQKAYTDYHAMLDDPAST